MALMTAMATVSVERICSHGAMAMPRAVLVSSSQAGASSVSMVGCRRSAAAAASALTETMRFVGRRGGARGSSFSVCRSSVRPLSASNGNVVEFQTGVYASNLRASRFAFVCGGEIAT